METVDQRLLKLELIEERHQEDLRELRDASRLLKNSLEAIESTLQQIKYLADEVELQDADGNLMTAEEAKAFVATLP